MIEVTYDGKFPNACAGTLTITVDGEEVYSQKYECRSTGGVSFTKDWEEIITHGELVWDPEEFKPSPEIQAAVADVLSGVTVCCGGCV